MRSKYIKTLFLGVFKVFGQPGVEFYGQHTPPQGGTAQDVFVQQIEWIPDSGRLITLTAANLITLWEPAGTLMVPIKTIQFEGKLKKISALCCSYVKDFIWIGTEGGNVFQLDIKTFEVVAEPVINHDGVLDQVPKNYRHNSVGAIEHVKQLPSNYKNLLVSYNRGLCILWDLEESKMVRAYISPGHGQSVGLDVEHDGEKFTWYHADDSYATWYVDSSDPPEEAVPYRVDPCKAINQKSVASERMMKLSFLVEECHDLFTVIINACQCIARTDQKSLSISPQK